VKPGFRKNSNPKMRTVSEVSIAVVVCYLILGLFGAKGIYHWATRLPDGEVSAMLRALSYEHWRNAAAHGLEQPGIGIERWFLGLQGASKSSYPLSYVAFSAHKKRAGQMALARQAAVVANGLGGEELPPDFKGQGKHGPRILVLGDSLMMTLGPVVKKDVEAKLGGFAWVKAKLGTGLARPDLFDWAADLKRTVGENRFDAVIMMFGTNDSQDFYEEGVLLGYGSEPWVRAYNRRLAVLMAATCEHAQHGFWMGMPPMRNPVFARKMLRINHWAAQQVARHPCMQYLATEQVIGDIGGGFADYLEIQEHLEKVRTLDGIHVTTKGGGLISADLIEHLKASLRLREVVVK